MSKQELKQKGFTIIEVVLVLAIAALIFLMVFIALPALQRNQRDQALKTVQGKVVSAIGSYQSSHRNQQFGSVDDLLSYLDADSASSVDGYTIELLSGTPPALPGTPTNDKIYIAKGMKCSSDGTALTGGSTRNAAVVVKPENGTDFSCQAA